jgi:valyl-tRNA synthetase
MSKTTGNVIDPLETIDKFGCDALRYSLVTGSTPGQDIPLSMERIEGNRNFANKLWNAGKYLNIQLASLSPEERQALAVTKTMTLEEIQQLPLAERYIVSKCHELVESVTDALEAYSFGDAGRQIQEFLWDEYADWYIEVSKTRSTSDNVTDADNAKKILVYVWDRCMRLLHPFMPFLTETLWQLAPHEGDSIMVADWPVLSESAKGALGIDQQAIKSFSSIQALVRSIRNARAEYNVEPGKKIATTIVAPSDFVKENILAEQAAIALLGRIDETMLEIKTPRDFNSEEMGKAVHLVVEDENAEGERAMEAYLPMESLVDADKEVKRLTKQAEKLKKDIATLEGRLNSKGFADKAPENVIAEVKGNIADKKEQLSAVEKGLSQYV